MNASIKKYCDELVAAFAELPEERKKLLSGISEYIKKKSESGKDIHLVYICTHNSRRSHFGQVWAKTAAEYFGIPNVKTYSGGTEATEFNPNAIAALERVGFLIQKTTEGKNPVYHVFSGEDSSPNICFSKVYDHPENPQKEFAAIMTCSDAEQNCPFIPGVELRVGTTYDDPKAFDHTPLQNAKYDERCRQIAMESLFVFSLLK
ncbi:MAG: protein-tyrosine-phosphatase [Flavobacteriales bacterium]